VAKVEQADASQRILALGEPRLGANHRVAVTRSVGSSANSAWGKGRRAGGKPGKRAAASLKFIIIAADRRNGSLLVRFSFTILVAGYKRTLEFLQDERKR